MRKKLLISFLLLLAVSFTTAIAQITVTGTVISADDEEPIPGVSISIRGTTTGTVTDVEGNYSIEVPDEEAILEFSFVGKQREEIVVGEQRTIDVELESDVVGLDEVVVTGYGVQRRRDLTGSVSSVRSESIEGMPVESIQRAIQGRAAGVQVTAGSGVPGGDVSVIVRGMGSFSANRPIWIVDGVEVQTGGLGMRSESESILASLDFEDIESIDVLKDAAATAIYGARGANGVIVISTRRGEAADDTDFTFDIRRGYTEPIRTMPVMSGPQWAQWDYERYANRYGADHSTTQSRIQTGVDRGWYELGADGVPDFTTSPNYDWQDEAYRQGNVMEARLTARGGDERTRFYTSLSHNMTEGHVIAYDFSRSSFRLNLDHDATDRLSFDMQVSANLSDQNSTRLGGAWSSPVRGGGGIPPVEPIFTHQAEEAGLPVGQEFDGFYNAPRSVFGAYRAHILNSAKYDHLISRNLKTILNLSATYDITDNLMYRSTFGVDYNANDEEQWYDPRASDGHVANGVLRDYETSAYAIQTTQTLNYQNIFADVHEINTVVGYETWERIWRRTAVRGENFPNPHMNVINAAADAVWWSGNETERATVGAFGRANYSYDDRYMLTLTARYDGSSRFGSENRWGFFPAAAIGWRLSSEPFMAGVDQLDNLVVRLSYGTAGSDAAGTYAALGLWSGGTQYRGTAGIYPTQLPNAYLTWEESRTLNLALSAAGFGGRVNLDIDLFNRWTEELLLARPLPRSTGWSSITENVGRNFNHGFEMALNTVNIERENFRWSTEFNLNFIEGEILELLPGEDFFSDRRKVGQAINDRNIPMYAGVNPADGRPMYYDRDWNITYNPVYEDRHWMGPEQPTRFGGITNTFNFGNFSTSIFFQYSGGSYRYFSDARFWFHGTGDRNQLATVFEDRWQEAGDMTDAPRVVYGNVFAGNVQSPNSYASHMFERVDYLRLKDLSVSYEIPAGITQRYGIDNMRIFARGSNLVTWTDYSGTDPEFTGSDFGTYPQGRTLTFGISTNF